MKGYTRLEIAANESFELAKVGDLTYVKTVDGTSGTPSIFYQNGDNNETVTVDSFDGRSFKFKPIDGIGIWDKIYLTDNLGNRWDLFYTDFPDNIIAEDNGIPVLVGTHKGKHRAL